MAGEKYILAIDQGTTGSAAILFDSEGNLVADADRETKQIYPRPGWVEHDPNEILQTSLQVAREVIQKANIQPSDVAGLGITNQRETTIVWDKKTGKPIEPKFEKSASLIEDPETQSSGPIWLKGGVELEGADGFKYEKRNRVTLCRCGRSRNKPFCDASHIEAGFTDGDKSIRK